MSHVPLCARPIVSKERSDQTTGKDTVSDPVETPRSWNCKVHGTAKERGSCGVEHSRQIVYVVNDRDREVGVPKPIGIQKIVLGIKH